VQGFLKEAFGGLGIPCRTQEKLERVPLRIDRPGEVHPDVLHFDGGLLLSPGVVTGFEMRPRALVQFWGRVLDESELF